YEKAHVHWPTIAWPALGLANVRYASGDVQGAEEGYRTALALDPNNVVANNNLAELLFSRGCLDEARTFATRALTHAAGTPLEQAATNTAVKLEHASPRPDVSCE